MLSLALFVGVLALSGGTAALVAACSTPQAKTAEVNLCKARAEWKKIARAAGGALDPVPGSPRAELEAAEDVLCNDVPTTTTTPPPTDGGTTL